ncbi:MAG: hypothetical protein M5U28_23255 [Sandaracinaceae bacterium]|nr:hypothetical protein [Sandaracinaceae bacterium]
MRDALVRALEADLVGPFHPPERAGPTDEVLPLAPSRWYLTGFLAPERDRETRDPTAEDDFAGTEDEPEETAAPEPPPKQRHPRGRCDPGGLLRGSSCVVVAHDAGDQLETLPRRRLPVRGAGNTTAAGTHGLPATGRHVARRRARLVTLSASQGRPCGCTSARCRYVRGFPVSAPPGVWVPRKLICPSPPSAKTLSVVAHFCANFAELHA